jgi:peptidoglycan L-alanyl-D-glutamate endopeptidase CwlK
MSQGLFGDDVIFLQRFLKSAGFFAGEINGNWGADTDAAVQAFDQKSQEIATQLGTLDPRSERSIVTLHPKAQELARASLAKILAAGITARIISGTRTYAEQDQLFEQGRSLPGNRVTNARGGESNHNFCVAWDIGIFNGGAYLGDSPLYTKAAEAGLVAGLEWGGNWHSFKDKPHYQIATGLEISAVRQRFELGQSYV